MTQLAPTHLFVTATLALSAAVPAQEEAPRAELPSAEIALERTLAHHDPGNVWSTRSLELTVEVELKERLAEERGWTHRTDRIALDLSTGWFRQRTERGELEMEIEELEGTFTARLNGSEEIRDEDRDERGLTPEQMRRRRDYSLYVYGLPMKLRDPGTRLDPAVRRAELEGRQVLALRVTYDAEVGEDIWYFYLDPETWALVGCRFFHDESANDGEYLVFEGEVAGPGGLRLPARRRWHMNRDGEHIATDDVVSIDLVDRD